MPIPWVTISVTYLRENIGEIGSRLDRDECYVVTKHQKPQALLVSARVYESAYGRNSRLPNPDLMREANVSQFRGEIADLLDNVYFLQYKYCLVNEGSKPPRPRGYLIHPSYKDMI